MSETRTFSIVPTPNQGLLTAWSDYSIQQFPQSYKSLRDVVIRDNSFQAIKANVPAFLAVGATPIWAIHYFNTSDRETYILNHNGGDVGGMGSATLYDSVGNAILTTTYPHELFFLDIKDRCFIAGQVIESPWKPWVLGADGLENYAWGRPGPAGELAYTGYGNVTIANIGSYYNPGNVVSAGASTVTVTNSDNSFDNSGAWAGAQISIYVSPTATETYIISTVTATNSLTLVSPTTATPIVNKPYLVHYGSLSWTVTPPVYSYSYYNPTTGHSTNGSPLTTISEQNQSNVNVELVNIQGTNDPQYTHIILFRTDLGGGGTPTPLRLDPGHGGTADIETTAGISQFLIVNDYVGTKTYIDKQPDSERQKVIGKFTVPQDINNPPPEDIKFMAYWNGQVFLSTISEPWRLRYSRQTSTEQLGVGEESFPVKYYTDLSADSGYITGLCPVGESLIVCTDKYLYTAVGTPNNYGLVRVSSRGVGVNHYAIDEHPGDSTSNTASALYVGRDKRLWRHYPGGQLLDIGAPIQDKLDAPVGLGYTSHPYIVKVCTIDRYQLLALGIINGLGTYYDFYFFDFDTSMWLDLGFSQNSGGGVSGWSIGTGLDYGAGGGGGDVRSAARIGLASGNAMIKVMANTVTPGTAGVPTANGETHFMDMGDWNSKKVLEGVVFYVSNSLHGDYSCGVRFDKSLGGYTQLARLSLAGSPRDLGPGTIFFDTKNIGVKQWHSIQLQWFIGGAATTDLCKIHRIEVIYSMESTGISGKP